jgi:hypothetical protein
MSKINNTTAYATTTPTNNTMFIGSETAGGATKNYLVSELSSFINLNPTLTSLAVSGNATIGGQLLVTGLLQVGSFTMTAVPTFFNGITALGGTTSLVNTTVSGLPKLTALSTFADNAAAVGGGLVANDVYKTATGELRIVV